MKRSRWQLEEAPALVRSSPLTSLAAAQAVLQDGEPYWGFFSTPAEIRLEQASGAAWREHLAHPRLLEVRVFSGDLDLHWREGRGVLLEEEAAPAAALAGGAICIGGPGWMGREQRSRLWGEHLEGTDTFYEGRIPDPWRYPGLTPGPAQRYAFLRYREYLKEGVVRHVRYLEIVGGER